MKTTHASTFFRSALIAAIGLAGANTLLADSGGHLLLGITQSGHNTTGNDLYYDLGPAASLTNGMTWDLSALLTAQDYTLSQIQWGVLGDSRNGDTQFKNPHTGLTWYSDGVTPQNLSGYAAFNSLQNWVDSVEQTVTGAANMVSTNGQNRAVYYSGTSTPSWYELSITPGSWYEATGRADVNVTGTGSSEKVWLIVNDDSAPTQIGTITLNSSGVFTFSTIPNTPPAPRIVAITRTNNTSWIYFTTTNSYTYKLHYTNAAGLGTAVSNWPAATMTVTGSGGAATNHITDTTSDPIRFYSVGVQ